MLLSFTLIHSTLYHNIVTFLSFQPMEATPFNCPYQPKPANMLTFYTQQYFLAAHLDNIRQKGQHCFSHNNNNNNCIESRNLRFLQSPHCAMNCLKHVRYRRSRSRSRRRSKRRSRRRRGRRRRSRRRRSRRRRRRK